MKKIIVAILFTLLFFNSNASVRALEPDDRPVYVKSDCKWLNLRQTERDAKIKYYKKLAFDNNNVSSIKNEDFKKAFRRNMLDAKADKHYTLLVDNGVVETNDSIITAYFKQYSDAKMLDSYVIQPKNDLRRLYYYSADGKLYALDCIIGTYPRFPYIVNHYKTNGKLSNVVYFLDKDTQYVYKANGKFKGFWYKNKMYNRKGNEVLLRNNW